MIVAQRVLCAGVFLCITGGVALAQTSPNGALPGNDVGTGSSLPKSPNASNIEPGDTKTSIAPTSPVPSLSADASVQQLLCYGAEAIKTGKTGTGEDALEQAESAVLDRSVAHTQTAYASDNQFVQTIDQARMALGADDRGKADAIITQLLSSGAPELQD
jgi:hypothetical protein